MLIGLTGTVAAGVHSCAKILNEKYGFQKIVIESHCREGDDDDDNNVEDCVIRVGNIDEALELITPQWKNMFVVYPIESLEQADKLKKRPFAFLIGIDAPIMQRFERCKERCRNYSLTLEQFVAKDDQQSFGDKSQKRAVYNTADHMLLNDGSMDTLVAVICQFDPVNPEHVRPSWDSYFMKLAHHASLRSNCMKRRVGAVLVKSNRVIATGYNGTPRGTTNCNDSGCPRCNGAALGGQLLDQCFCMHAEENALLEAGRSRGEGSTMYTTLFPCLNCAKKMVQVGVAMVIYSECYVMDELSQALFTSVGMKVKKHEWVADVRR